MIIENTILSNLSIDNDNPRVFECRTSISNPQAQLTITRQGNDGQKYLDIQYKTSSTYINGINSIQFMVRSFLCSSVIISSIIFLVTTNRYFFSWKSFNM